MLLLEQDTPKKERIDENVTKLDASNNESEKYKLETIFYNAVYEKKSKSGYLPRLYYLVFWKGYLEEKNT